MVDLSDPRAASVMQAVRQRVASVADAGATMRRAREAAARALEALERDAMASHFGRTGRNVCLLERLPSDRPLWIVGDVRGDVVALATALAFIDETDAGDVPPSIAFLGDWTGGVAGDAACAALVLERFLASPERTLLLRGDREWLAPLPIDMPPAIHAMPRAPSLERLHGEMCDAIEAVARRLPAMALLPDGVVLAHGCLPRVARLRGANSLESLEACEKALRDCSLGQLHLREMRVKAGEREGGVLLGVEDFGDSLRALAEISGRPLNRLVRGQDAAPEGFRWFKAYGPGAVLTLTTMADPLPESAGGGHRRPCLGRLKGGRIRVVRMAVPEEVSLLGDQLFPRAPAAPATRSFEPKVVPTPVVEAPVITRPTPAPAAPSPVRAAVARDPDPAASARSGPEACRVQFERGVRLLQARAWAGARDAFRSASNEGSLQDACALNEAVACLWLGTAGHQEALARLRALRQTDPRDPAVLLNMGIAFLVCERNPSEALRALRSAVDAAPDLADAWWALGLAAAMRSDSSTAAGAFTRAADAGCGLPVPGSLHGLIPARELAPALDALRGLARHKPKPEAPPIPVCG